jgi:hypothetical protein
MKIGQVVCDTRRPDELGLLSGRNRRMAIVRFPGRTQQIGWKWVKRRYVTGRFKKPPGAGF